MKLRRYLSRDRFSLRQVIGMLTLVIVGISVLTYAAVTIPYTFTSGTTAKSSEVNANFQAIATAMNNRTSAISNMAGTWNYTSTKSQLNSSPPSAALCVTTGKGTITLNADGTGSIVEYPSTTLCIASSSGSAAYPNTGGTSSATWTVLADGSGTITVNGVTFNFQASRDLNTFVLLDESVPNDAVLITAMRQ